MTDQFQIATITPGLLVPRVALAAARAGALGILDFEYSSDHAVIAEAVRRFSNILHAPFGIKLDSESPELLAHLDEILTEYVRTVVLTSSQREELRKQVRFLRERNVTTLFEVTCIQDAELGERLGVHGLIAKGHEAGGRVADETTFILLQRLLPKIGLPLWAQGGIGVHTVGACAAAGAAGVVIDSQLALSPESPLPEAVRARIASMDGSETICLGDQVGETYRMYFRPGNAAVKELQEIEARLASDDRAPSAIRQEWRRAIAQRAGWQSEQDALLLGQDAAFAAPLADQFRTVGGIVQGLHSAVRKYCETAAELCPLTEGSPLAVSNGTRYPILQGPMTRVSDVPEFAARVAEGGALPFLALALMRGPEVEKLLEEARQRLGKLSWGVGILGFVPQELRDEQAEVIRRYRPRFALIAGGRPEQARALEQEGITTYLHVPSPGLLRMFIEQGARRFVFEGRECGGHVGPRTSFVLWSQMIDTLLAAPQLAAGAQEFHIVFAAGIHDALSAAMVSIIAAPLAQRGVRVGVLVGTAYLFTEEAVASGAILGAFQAQALECSQTVLLTTGPGHSTRCADTPYATAFANEKRRLAASGSPAEEIRMALEELNLGRLRIASKGVTRHAEFGRDPAVSKLQAVEATEQVAQGMYMIGQVAALRNQISTVAALHHDISAGSSEQLAMMVEAVREDSTIAPMGVPSDVAIVGMSCLLPKAPDLGSYWENIIRKIDAVGEVPKERWDSELYFDSDPKAKDKVYSKWGGFLEDIPFDPVQYGMPPASLRSIEPAQLLTLQVVRAALDDAGYGKRPFARERTSVILGAGGGAADLGLGYSARSFLPVLENLPEFRGRSGEIIERLDGRLPEWTEDSFAGILTNVSAGRVANRFDLGGSNFTVDAACASSLAAVSLAVKELESRTSDMVIVGGVDTMQNPFTYLCFSKTHALSPRGRCRPFDESADGIAISEGVAMMVLKRLSDAERDGDRIYAVIKASGSSSDGKDRGLTAPRPEGQVKALKRAYAKANFSPASVGLIEAHGTGTVAGDGAEVQALTDVFSEAQAARQSCAIGSVKSMIGHTKCTAGAAGLIKAALALHHKILPPTLGVTKPNPRARLHETPFFVNTDARPWLENPAGHPRRAGVSAFGFGGTNFHLVLEEYTGDPLRLHPAPFQQWSDELFIWRAASRQSLAESLEAWEQALSTGAKPALRDLAYTAWKQAEKNPAKDGNRFRLALVASSLDDLKEKLAKARQGLAKPEASGFKDPKGIYFSEHNPGLEGKVAFLFPGQGSQYPGMLQDLLLHFPEMRQVFESAAGALTGKLPEPLSSYVFPPPAFSKEEEHSNQKRLTQTNVAQPALGAVSLAMFHLFGELGLRADMLGGHSYGEYVALAAAGVFEPADLIAVSEVRGRFIVEGATPEPGVMAAIEADGDIVADATSRFEGVCLANANAPTQSVISGTREGVQKVVEHFAAQGTAARMVPVACAFHSPLVAPAQTPLAEFLSTVEMADPAVTVYSNTTAAPYPATAHEARERLIEHLVKPVEFAREIEAMYNDGARVFVEVGPRGVLTNLVKEILRDRPHVAVASNQSSRPGLTQLLHTLAQLAVQGCGLKLDRLYRDRAGRVLDLRGLTSEHGQKPLAPSVWMVNGARAVPLKQPATPTFRREIANLKAATAHKTASESVAPRPERPPASASATSYANGAPQAPASPPASAQTPVSARDSHPSDLHPSDPHPKENSTFMSSPAASDGVPQLMSQFQQTMARFLDTQKAVMLSYLGAETHAGAPVAALGIPAPEMAAPLQPHRIEHNGAAADLNLRVTEPSQFSQPAVSQPAVPADAASDALKPAQSALPGKAELTATLLAIVSERTGYPEEMLDLNLDLEAGLGIDSIKRVEILGTFQQSFPPEIAALDASLMEKLAGVRTLQAIIDRVCEQMVAAPGAAIADAPPSIAPPQEAESAPVASAVLDQAQLTAQLLEIVSERTGYPPEMLDVNLDLEADLGIDSIKRVEILGTLQQSFAAAQVEMPEGLLEKLAGVRTLQGIIDQVLAPQSTESTAPVQPMPAPVPSTSPVVDSKNESAEDGIQRFTLTTIETAPKGAAKSIAKDLTILIAGGHAAGRALGDELTRCGYKVALVRQGGEVREVHAGEYTADFGSLESTHELLALVNHRQGLLGGMVHLLALDGQTEFASQPYAGWKEQLRLNVKSLFHLAKAAGAQLRAAGAANGATVLAATAMGGAFLAGASADPGVALPDHGAIAGLIKTLAREWPEVRAKVVDLNAANDSAALSGYLSQELLSGDESVEVGYDGARRLTLQLEPAPLRSSAAASAVLDSSSVVVITGGARGITALAAERIAELYRPTLVLAGRSPLPPSSEGPETAGITAVKELKAVLMGQLRAQGQSVTPVLVERAYARLTAEREIRSNLEALRSRGAKVHYDSVDVRDPDAFGAWIDSIYATFGRIDAVIHGAGVIEDKLIQDKTPESFDRVFDTKVDSAFVLSRKLRPEGLKFLVFFSSVSGRFGNRGQGDYAAANEVLNKLAACLDRSWPGRVVAMDWGPWDTGGMITAEVRKQFAERGIVLIPPATGLRRLEEEINYGRRGESEVVIGGAAWQSTRPSEPSHDDYPLLGSAFVSRNNGAVELVRELDPKIDVYLKDHCLDGKPVLPLAIATELIAETVAQAWPEMEISAIRDLRLLHGVVLDNGPRSVRVAAKPPAGSATHPASIAVEITGTTPAHRLHYRAHVELAQALSSPPTFQIAPLADGGTFSMSIAEFYARWLFHGPMFQGVGRVNQVGSNGVTAMLATSSPASWIMGASGGRWLIDPLTFDSALQLVVLWARKHWDMTALPNGFERYRRFGAAGAGPVLCEVRLRPTIGRQTIHADMFFFDAGTGRLISVLENMEGACSKALNRLAERNALVAVANQP